MVMVSSPFFRPLCAFLLLAMLAAGCTDDSEEADLSPTTTTVSEALSTPVEDPLSPPTSTIEFEAAVAAVTGPITAGNGPVLPQPAVAAPAEYVQEEFFVGGAASSFVAVDEFGDDGMWSVAPDDTADYQTRILVRRPPTEVFSGTVIVEWLNVTAVEASPDWAFLVEEIGAAGHAYVAVSAQALGVIGGQALLTVEVDPDVAEEAGRDADEADTGGLINADPERYGALEHPGDAFAYDIFTQVGAVVRDNAGGVLGNLDPEVVIALGESQSAGFLTTYVNAIHPMVEVFDGFLVHSRGGGGAPLAGVFGDDASFVEAAHRIRTDLDVPVFMVEAETDLTLLGYARARQDDTDMIRAWELAGTAHADAHVIRAIIGGPRTSSSGNLLGCTNAINTGPHHEGIQAALRGLVTWVREGTAPPIGERIETTETVPVQIVRDELGIALGGVRNPLVDVPVVITTGDPWEEVALEGGFDVCSLFGRTIPIEQAGLLDLHGSADGYLAAFDVAADAAVDAGFLLDYDAEQLRAEAQANTVLFE